MKWTTSPAALVLALALAPGGCGGDRTNPAAMDDGTTDATTTTGASTNSTAGAGAAADEGDTLGPEPTDSSSGGASGSTGAAEDEGFGMDDDMPLVCDIPDIKDGTIAVGELVRVRRVRATTPEGRAAHGAFFELYVQDSEGGARSGIMVRVDGAPLVPIEPGDEVTVTGLVRRSDGVRYLLSSPDDVEVLRHVGDLEPQVLDTNTLGLFSPVAADFEGVLVRLEDVDVTAFMPSGAPVLDGVLHLDSRFAGELPALSPGQALMSVMGPLMITPSGLAIGPRTSDEVVP